MSDDTIRLAHYAARLKYEDISDAVLQRVKNTLCDVVGAIIYGYELPWSKMICDYATTYGAGGKSQILANGLPTVQPPFAALANGALAHAFELDGAVKPSVGAHPAATIFPAALAVAQENGSNGRALVTAFVAGTEVMLRVGAATQRSNEARGFHAPGTTGPFGAAIAAGRLLGLDGDGLVNALGVAASLAGGLVQFSRSGTGGMVKRLHFGRASESGVLAAELAKRGFEGPHDAIEGEFGFLRAFCNTCDMSRLTESLGEKFMTTHIYMKPYACHGSAQAPLQALQDLHSEHAFGADDIDSILVAGNHELVDRHGDAHPKDPMLAQYSLPFSVAVAFIRNAQDPRSFDWSAVEDPAINALSARVTLKLAESSAPSVTVMLNDGRTLTKEITDFKGAPTRPPQRDDVYAKYTLLTSHLPRDQMDALFERLQNIERADSFEWLKL